MFKVKVIFLLLAFTLVGCGQSNNATSDLNVSNVGWTYGSAGNLQFSESNKALIKSAMRLVNERIDSNDVWACANDNRKRWMVRNTGQNVNNYAIYKDWNRRNQRAFVQTEKIGIDVFPFSEATNVMGRAIVEGAVRSEIDSTDGLLESYKLVGRYTIKLNVHQLNNPGWNSPAVWAGVIAHEMLHQMGYSHDAGNYEDDMFITVFGDCLENDGQYVSRASGLNLNGRRFAIPD